MPKRQQHNLLCPTIIMFGFKGCLVISTLIQCCFSASVLTIQNNGYENVLVGISPDVKEDSNLIDSIKELLTNSSTFLYKAMRKRAYFKDVKILIPKTWTRTSSEKSTDDTFEDSHIRVAPPSQLHGEIPYARQTRGCGEPGDFIHLTPKFFHELRQETWENYGDPAKVLVHEWAHLRYGVFDEHGFPQDENHPFFYRSMTGKMMATSCANDHVYGERWDKDTYLDCNVDPKTGLPDTNCYFSPFENSTVHTSVMSFSFLETVDTFCDDTPRNRHNVEAPTKHNIMCNYRSTWDVITSSDDFRGNKNPPKAITVTTPKFTVIRQETPRFVLVADISSSMSGDRIERLAQTARSWIKRDVEDDTTLGIVQFSTRAQMVAAMTRVTASTRQTLINQVPSSVSGSTCIGCGLEMARGMLRQGGTIILITDGAENESPRIADVIGNLIQANIRVITIAFTDAADSKIEELAEKTTGGSFFVREYQDFSQAFKKSTTSQSTALLGEQDIILYDQQLSQGGVHRDTFVVDRSAGRDFVFQVDLRRQAFVSSFVLITPSGNRLTQANAEYDPLGAYRIKQPLAQVGSWSYEITLTPPQTSDFARIYVKTKPRDSKSTTKLIHTKCQISTGSAAVNPQKMKVSILAEVLQGNSPVIGVSVRAKVSRPNYPPDFIDLYDNGTGADITKNDGIYSRYFTAFTNKGRYSVQCLVKNQGAASVRQEGFIGSTVYPRKPALLDKIFSGNQELLNTVPVEEFTRQSTAGSFQVVVDIKPNDDLLPPGRVTDLLVSVVHLENRSIAIPLEALDAFDSSSYTFKITWTSTGDDLDQGKAFRYDLKVAELMETLKKGYDGNENLTVITEDDLLEGSLQPLEAGQMHSIVLNRTSLQFETNVTYFFALKAYDETYKSSDLSNIPFAFILHQVKPEPKRDEPKRHAILMWLEENQLILIISCSAIIFSLAVLAIILTLRRNKRHQGIMVVYQKQEEKYADNV